MGNRGLLSNGTQWIPFIGGGSPIPVETVSLQPFIIGAVKPLGYYDEAAGRGTRNVGPRLTNLTAHAGDYTLTAGAQVRGLDISGRIIGRGDANTLVTDCIIRGRKPALNTQESGVVGTSYNLGGARFEWCRIDIDANNAFTNSIDGGNYTLRFSEVYGGVDAISANTYGNATIEGCRISHSYYDSWWDASTSAVRTVTYVDAGGRTNPAPFPNQASGDTHADGVQIHQFDGWVIRGNYIGNQRAIVYTTRWDPTVLADYNKILATRTGGDFSNAVFMISSASSVNVVGALIEKNWIEGGAARVNIAWKSYDAMSGITLRDNRIIRSAYGFDFYIHNLATPTLSGNVYDNDGAPVTITRWG